MSARSISTLAITVTANTGGASTALVQLENQVASSAANINKQSALIGGALGGLFGGKASGALGFVGGLLGGPAGAAVGAGAGSAIDGMLSGIAGAIHLGVSAVGEAVKEMVRVGSEYEMAIAVFSAATGSETKGRSILKGLQDLAAGTIFSSEQLSHQARLLMGYGVAVDNLIPSMTKLALIAQKTGRGEEGLGRIALAFGQVKQANRLFGTELRQFTEAGVGVNEFAKTMGVSAASFRDLVESGQVGFNVVAQTINRMGSEAETVAEKMNATFIGRVNSVKDLALQAFGEIGMSIIKAFGLNDALGGIASMIQGLPEKTKELVPYLERARELVMPIATGLYAGGTALLEAGKLFITGFMPSMKDSQATAKSLGETLAVGMGTAVDYAITFGIELTKGMIAAVRIITPMLTDVNDVIAALKFAYKISGAKMVMGAVGSSGPAGNSVEAAMQYALQALRETKEGGSYAARAKTLFAGGLPALAPFAANFDQSGTTVGAASLPQAVTELAKSINEAGLTGKGQKPAFVEFATGYANLMKAESAGLIQSKGAADSFLFQQFKTLTGGLGRLENRLPAAMDRFTVEGQAQIDKVIANMQDRGMDDVPGLLKQAMDIYKQQLAEQKKTVDELRKLAPTIPVVVGG